MEPIRTSKPQSLPGKGVNAKKQPRWRELTDEEQWDQIYKGRDQKRRAAPKSVRQAVGLALPGYCLHMAIVDCQATFQAEIRHDVHVSVLASVAKVASLLPENSRDEMGSSLEHHFGIVRRAGFFIDNREFLYAVSHATVKLVDDWRYPADSPATMAALMLKEDAETDEAGDWKVSKGHAMMMAGKTYDAFIETELYGDPETVIKNS